MFTKLLSLVLSFTLVFTTMSPAFAEAANAAATTRARVDAGVDRAVQSQRGKKFAVKDKAAEVRAVVKAMGQGGSEKLSYKDFAAEYKKEMKNLLVQVMGEAKTDEERAYIKQVWTAMMTEKAIRAEYKQYQKLEQESLKEAEKEVNAYLRRLGREVMAIYKVNKREGLALIKEALPVFASVGAIEFNVKKEAAGVLRQAIKAGEKSCGSVGFLTGIKAKAGYKDSLNSQVKGCQSVLEAAYALSVLGADDSKGQSADAKVLGDLLAKGYNGLMGPSLIVMVSKGLLAMHGERTLTAELVKISRDFPDIGLFGNDFSFISVADWVKASSIMKGEYAMGMEYSFYKGGKYANLNNAWLDLGQYLAQEAKAGDKSAAYVLNTVMDESVWYDSYGNPGVKFKPFVTGALAGGYRINKPGRAYTQLDGNGKTQHIDTRKEWNRALAKMKKLNMTQSGYFASSLYYSGKGDLDPYTNIYINNKLVDGYRLSGSRAQLKNFGKRARPTAAELQLYKELQHAQTVGNVIDVALAVFFMGKLALSAVKMGVQGIKSGVRVLKLARSGAAANGLGFGKNFSRVIRLGRLQKYGVHSAKELLRSRLSGVMGTQHTKIVGGVKNFRQADAAKKAADAKRAAAAQAKADAAFAQTAEVRSVDGVAHVIPSGMDLVRVNGRPVLVKKGLSFSEIAKNFGVAESAVSEAKAGSSMAAVSAPRYTTSGAAAAVEGKVQPAMGPKPVAAEVAEPVGTKGSVVKSPVRYVQVETTNALGNKVMSWKPVTPEIAKPKPSFWKNFKERFLWNWYGLTDFAGSLGQAAQNGRSSGVLALGLNMGSVPMQAVKAEASLLAQGVKTEHVLTLKNMVMYSDELAKVGWSGASFRVGTPNVGGMQNMGRLPQVGSPFGATGPALGMLGTLNATNIANNLSDSRAQAARYQMETESAYVPASTWKGRMASALYNLTPKWLASANFVKALDKKRGADVSYTYHQVAYNPQTGEVKDLEPEEKAPKGSKLYTIAQNYNFVSTQAQYQNPQVAEKKSNIIADFILKQLNPSRADLIWIMASAASADRKIMAHDRIINAGYKAPTAAEVLRVHSGLGVKATGEMELSGEDNIEISEAIIRMMNEQENRMRMVPAEEQLLSTGVTEDQLVGVDSKKLQSVLYSANDVRGVLSPRTSKTFWGNTRYRDVLPVYVRGADGTTSSQPQVYLILGSKQSVVIPRGFQMVLDEIGQFKLSPSNIREIQRSNMPYPKQLFKAQPNFLDGVPFVQNNPKRLRDWEKAARHRVFETDLKGSELSSLSYVLSRPNSFERVAVLPLKQSDQFENLMQVVALVAGADLGASLSSQFKKMFSSDVMIVLMSGFGYISPLVVNILKPLINKYGFYNMIRAGLYTMAAISAVGVADGMYFNFDASKTSLAIPLLFMATAIITASLFSTLASPVLKNAYSDSTVFSSKNMAFTTTKGLSRLLVTIIPALVISVCKNFDVLPADMAKPNWSMLVPVMGALSLAGIWMLRNSRLHSEHVAAKQEAKKAKELAKDQPHEQVSKAEAKAQKAAAKRAAKLAKKQQKAKYQKEFKEPLAPITSRLGKIYEAYAPINSVAIGVMAGMLYEPDTALAISASGLFISWLVRKMADRLIKQKVITDDQLTGLSLPLMAAGIGLFMTSPFGSVGMMASWLLMYLATPTFGVSENTRMMNHVASYYKKERENVRNNEALSAEEKEAQMKQLKSDEAAMKMEAAAAYNRFNAKGFFTIASIAALFALFKETATADQLGQYADQIADILRQFGADPSAEEIKKGAPIDLSIYRLAAVVPFLISCVLLAQNRGMIKEGISRLAKSAVLTQEDIDKNDNILERLKFNPDQVKSNMEALSKEVEEVAKSVQGYARARTSEEKLQSVMNRMVWTNNRLKAVLDNTAVDVSMVSEELQSFRQSVATFRAMLKRNDVSDALRQEADQLFVSTSGILVSSDNQMAQFIQGLKAQAGNIKDSSYLTLVDQMEAYMHQGDLARLENALSAVKDMMTASRIPAAQVSQVAKDGAAIVKVMKLKTATVQSATLKYLPEVKLSLWDSMREAFGGNPARGVFTGSDVRAYESAKAIERELETLMKEMKDKKYYDGMRKDFQTYYAQALKDLKKYAKVNGKKGQPITEKRIDELKAKLDALYEDFMRDTPPAEKQSVKASAGKAAELSEQAQEAAPQKGKNQWPLDNLTRRNSMLGDFPAH